MMKSLSLVNRLKYKIVDNKSLILNVKNVINPIIIYIFLMKGVVKREELGIPMSNYVRQSTLLIV